MAEMISGPLRCLSRWQSKAMVMAHPPSVRLCARHRVDAQTTKAKYLPSSGEATVVGSQMLLLQGPLLWHTHTCPIQEQAPSLGSTALCVYPDLVAHHTKWLFANLSVSHASSLGSMSKKVDCPVKRGKEIEIQPGEWRNNFEFSCDHLLS